jgi:hypothetical protein
MLEVKNLHVTVDGKPAGPSPVNLFDLALLEYPYASTYEASTRMCWASSRRI